jgi:hypothetical protein
MANPNYVRTFDVALGSRVGSQALEDQFELVEKGFEGVYTETQRLSGLAAASVAGTLAAVPYTIDSATADADPGAGLLCFDNFAAQNAATVLRFDLLDGNGSDRTNWLNALDDSTSTLSRGILTITKRSDATVYLAFNVTALASPAGYRNVTATNIGASSAAPFADADQVMVTFVRTGDKGDTGAAGNTPLTYTARTSDTQLAAAGRLGSLWT